MKINIAKFFDGFLLAGKGILLAMKDFRFWVVFFVTFIIFGTLMNLLSNGFAAFQLMGAAGFSGSMKIIFDAFLSTFGVNKNFVDFFVIFFVAILQGILIGVIYMVAKKKKKANSENIEKAGIVTGLLVLGTGCPTCGTALLTPVLGAIFAGGSAIAGTVSGIITIIAVIIAILSLRKVGEECYVIIESEKYQAKKKLEEK